MAPYSIFDGIRGDLSPPDTLVELSRLVCIVSLLEVEDTDATDAAIATFIDCKLILLLTDREGVRFAKAKLQIMLTIALSVRKHPVTGFSAFSLI